MDSAALTHGRHCSCSACAREDWTKIVAPCGMHGPSCPSVYAPVAANARRAVRHGRRYRGGTSHIYQRLLRGEISPERYLAVMKRGVDMRMAKDREQPFARSGGAGPPSSAAHAPASTLRSRLAAIGRRELADRTITSGEALDILELCEALYTEPGPPAEVQRLIREAGLAPEWASRG